VYWAQKTGMMDLGLQGGEQFRNVYNPLGQTDIIPGQVVSITVTTLYLIHLPGSSPLCMIGF